MGSVNWELGIESGINILGGEVSLYSKKWVRSGATDSSKFTKSLTSSTLRFLGR